MTAPLGAYFFERINTAYGGPCCKVYNGTTTLDIGFGSDGFIDEAAIVAFCGASDGFLQVFYDQSGSGKHLSQTTTSLQHRIYIGATQLLNRRNGKPVFTNDGTSAGSRAVRLNSSIPNLGLSGNAAFTFGLRFRRIAGRNDSLPWGLGGNSADAVYAFAVSTSQQRLAFTEAGGTTVTYTTPTSLNTFQSAVITHASAAAFNAIVYRQDGTALSVASSSGSGSMAFIASSIPYWLTYRDVATNTTDRTETTPGAIVWGSVLSAGELATYETFLARYT